jgi:hypothetical protein
MSPVSLDRKDDKLVLADRERLTPQVLTILHGFECAVIRIDLAPKLGWQRLNPINVQET